MIWTWITVGIIIGIVAIVGGVGVMISGLDTDDKEAIRGGALIVTGGVIVAALWPLVLAAIVPGIMVYGIVVGVRALKNKTLDY